MVKEGNKKEANKARNGKLSVAITDVNINKVHEFLIQVRI
jgi:hypothetical protein